jgi:hypothetical protein
MYEDSFYAIAVSGFLLSVITFRQFPVFLLETLLKLGRSGATIVVLSLVALLYIRNMPYTALATALVSVYLLKDIWVGWVQSDARRFYQDVNADTARFTPRNSIDLQMANGTVKHAAPSMVSTASDPKMLIFPPSEYTLNEMCGPSPDRG